MTFLVERLAQLRRHLDHLYGLDYGLVVEALDDLDPVEEFIRAVASVIRDEEHPDSERGNPHGRDTG